MTPFPFFVGCDRSGTTLIQAVFDGHSRLAIPYESHFVVPLLRRRTLHEAGGRFDLDAFLVDLLAFDFAARWRLAEEELRVALKEAAPTDTPGAIRSVFDAYGAKHSTDLVGDKTPGYVRHVPLLAAAFPEGRFVHIVRDGRDVALSLLQMEWGPTSIVDAARFWKIRVDAGRTAATSLGPQRYTELRYEDFLEDPETETERVSAFLGLEFEPGMLDYSANAEKVLSQAKVPHRHQGLKDKPAKGRRDWRTQMEASDVALFEVIAGRSLSAFGYERAVPKPPWGAVARARTQQALRKAKGIPDRVRWELRPRVKGLPPGSGTDQR